MEYLIGHGVGCKPYFPQYGDYMVRSLIPVGLLSLARFGAFTYMFNMHFPRSVNSLFFVLIVVFVGSSRLFYRIIADTLRLRLSSKGDGRNVIHSGRMTGR